MSYRNGPRIVTDGLVLLLDAGNRKSYPGSGTLWTDLSGNSNNGTLTNGPTYNNENKGIIVLDGVDDFVSLGRPVSLASLFGTNAVSIDIWFRQTANIISQKILFDSGTNETIQIDSGSSGSNQLSFRITTAAGTTGATTSTLILGVWYNFIGVYDGTNIITYLNGVLSSQVAKTGTVSADLGSFYIGQWPGGGFYNFPGQIATARIYNRPLNSVQIQQNYNALKGRYGL